MDTSLIFSLLNNPNEARSQINNFAQNVQGDPRKKVEELVNSGQMSQETYNTLSRFAQMFMKIL